MVGPLVVDASALVDFLIDPVTSAFGPLLENASALLVPEVCDIEVTSAVLRGIRSGAIHEDDGMLLLLDYAGLPLERHGHLTLLGRIFELRTNFSAADAAYVALAERSGADLLTGDRHLSRAAADHTSVRCLP